MSYYDEKMVEFSVLKGKIIVEITGAEEGSDIIVIRCTDNTVYKMYHNQNCCENVRVDDVVGDVQDLIGHEILLAEETTNSDDEPYEGCDSWTWTFYKLATIKGYVDIKWLGTSNGYYSESVTIYEVEKEEIKETI